MNKRITLLSVLAFQLFTTVNIAHGETVSSARSTAFSIDTEIAKDSTYTVSGANLPFRLDYSSSLWNAENDSSGGVRVTSNDETVLDTTGSGSFLWSPQRARYYTIKLISSNGTTLSKQFKVVAPTVTIEREGANLCRLTASDGESEIRYTLDGSAPTTESKLYTGPFEVSKRQLSLVRASTFAAGCPQGEVSSAIFNPTAVAISTAQAECEIDNSRETRQIGYEAVSLPYDTAWEGDADSSVELRVDGELFAERTGAGEVEWAPEHEGLATLTLKTIATSGETLAEYSVQYDVVPRSITITDGSVSLNEIYPGLCHWITNIVVDVGVTSLVDGMFDGCSGLVSITIPDTVTSIGVLAFADCGGLESIHGKSCADLRLEHIECETKTAQEPTCTENGWTHEVSCSRCNAILVQSNPIDALGHIDGEGVVTAEPTFVSDGEITYYCTRCGAVSRYEFIYDRPTIPGLTLDDGWVVAPGCDSPWRVDADGIIRSGTIGDNGDSWMEAVVPGDCAVSFEWRTSSEHYGDDFWDYAYFAVDGVTNAVLGGETEWTRVALNLNGNEQHTLRWGYCKDDGDDHELVAGIDDCAWVRSFEFVKRIKVVFDLGGGTGVAPETVKGIAGTVFSLPGSGGIAKAKHDFAGWSDGVDVYNPGDEYAVPEDDMTMTAVWEAKVLGKPIISCADAENGWVTNAFATLSMDAEDGVSIYYTLDGSEPNAENGVLYSEPFNVEAVLTTVKAMAVKDDWFDSEVSEFTVRRRPFSLAECLNDAGLTAQTSGDAVWTRVMDEAAHDGDAALRSGTIGDGEASTLSITVSGPGVVSFWWKVSSERTIKGVRHDGCVFAVDGVELAYMDNMTNDWTRVAVSVSGEGEHLLSWTYSKDSNGVKAGEDCAWLDEIVWPSGTIAVNVTFDANGGECGEASREVEDGEAIGELPTPTRTGHVFTGWWTGANGGERIVASMVVDGEMTCYAHWVKCAATFTITSDGILKDVSLNGETKLTIPEGVVGIDEWALEDLEIESITLPSTLETIGEGALCWNSILEEIEIPSSVTSIARHAFAHNVSLKNIGVSSENTHFRSVDGVLYSADMKTILAYPAGKQADTYTIPSSVTEILDEAFAFCGRLENIYVEAGNVNYKSIDGVLFSADGKTLVQYPAGMADLRYDVQDGVEELGVGAFAGCKAIKEICCPDTLKEIEYSAFEECEALDSIEFPYGLTSIGDYAFCECESLKGITFRGNAPEVEENTFESVPSTCVVKVPRGSTGWGVSIPGTWQGMRIEYYGADYSYKVNSDGTITLTGIIGNAPENLVIPAQYQGRTVSAIGDCAFHEKLAIKSVILPNGLKSIGKEAFDSCLNLASINFPEGLEVIGYDALCGCESLGDVVIPSTVREGIKFPFAYEMNSVTVAECNPYFKSIDGVVYSKDGTRLICYPAGRTGEWTVPSHVMEIADAAFAGCSLSTVNINPEVVSIGQGAFICCFSLERVNIDDSNQNYADIDGVVFTKDFTTLIMYPPAKKDVSVYAVPSTVTTLYEAAFSGSLLEGVILPSTLRSIPVELFVDCANLTSVIVGCGLETVSKCAFYCAENIKQLTLPTSLKQIDGYAFEDCESLKTIYLPNGVDEDDDAFAECPAIVVRYSSALMVKFDLNYSGAPDYPYERNVIAGQPVGLLMTPGRDQYAFLGWFAGEDLVKSDTVVTGNLVLKAKWRYVFSFPDDEGATVDGDEENGYTVKPSAGKANVEVTIPEGVAADKVTVEVAATVETVKANGANVKVMKSGHDIAEHLDLTAVTHDGVINLAEAKVREEVVKETLDTEKGAEVSLGDTESPSLTTSETKPGLTYTLKEGTTLEEMMSCTDGDRKLGDGTKWTPKIKVKGGKSGFYTIKVEK